jgi:hypothetical protein
MVGVAAARPEAGAHPGFKQRFARVKAEEIAERPLFARRRVERRIALGDPGFMRLLVGVI